MNIRYKIKRLRVKLRGLNKKKLELNEIQQMVYNITIKMINNKNSNLDYDTLGRRFIENRETYISISRNHIFIVSDNLHDNIFIDDSSMDNVKEKFDSKIIRRMDVREKIAMSKVKTNLDTILCNISES